MRRQSQEEHLMQRFVMRLGLMLPFFFGGAISASARQATFINANYYLQQYIAAARGKPADERAALYAKYVFEPVTKLCGEGGNITNSANTT
jgi:hypothetical protein